MKLCLLFIAFEFSINCLFAQNITEIISQSEAKYKGSKTYFDSGKAVNYFYNLPHPFSNAKIFKTAYSKIGLFNFEYYVLGNSNSLCIIHQGEDKKVQSWWGITDKLETDQSLLFSLYAQKGVSSSTSTLIPELLYAFNNTYGNVFHTIKDPALQSTEDVNGKLCFKIVGNLKTEGTIKIWIAEEDYLIRKIETDHPVKEFRVKTLYQFFPYEVKKTDTGQFVFKPYRQITL